MQRSALSIILIAAGAACSASSTPMADSGVADKGLDPTLDGGQRPDLYLGDLGIDEPGCNICHGGRANAAPPQGMNGEMTTRDKAVGAHQEHLKSSDWRAPVRCDDCHQVPRSYVDPGHLDTALPAEVHFSPLSRRDGASPTWDGMRCSGTYCHGATMDGGQHSAPLWTTVDGTQITCTGCHGMPPGGTHPPSSACSSCHGDVVDANKVIIAANLHMDGVVQASANHPDGYASGALHGKDFEAIPASCKGGACHGDTYLGGAGASCESCHANWRTNCTFCHGGSDNATGAPPVDLLDNTATTEVGVGAHTSHVMTTNHGAYTCTTCHPSTSDALDAGHLEDSAHDITFGGIATGTTYDANTATCSDITCHGDGKGSGGSAIWTGSLAGGCSACHDDQSDGWDMTLSGAHDEHVVGEGYSCYYCHSCVVGNTNAITTPASHVNGVVDVCSPMNINWNAQAKSCSPPKGPCHDTLDWYPQ